MQFKEVLQKRRSVRSYRDQPLDQTTIHGLIEIAVNAPSARDSQPWEFWVILGRERIDDLARRAKNHLMDDMTRNASPVVLGHLSDPAFSLFYHAPALVLVAARTPGEQADEDCCLAALALMLAARDAELGSCWIGMSRPWFNLSATKEELGIPGPAHVVAPIVIGHPTEWPESPGRRPPEINWVR
jgi:nitroreductase